METRITVHEAEVLLWQKRRSTLQGNVTVYFIVFLTNVKLSPQLKKRTDFQQDNIIFLNELRARFGEKAESLYLKVGDEITFNGTVADDKDWGHMIKRASAIKKIK